jgi:hypothetical protein
VVGFALAGLIGRSLARSWVLIAVVGAVGMAFAIYASWTTYWLSKRQDDDDWSPAPSIFVQIYEGELGSRSYCREWVSTKR